MKIKKKIPIKRKLTDQIRIDQVVHPILENKDVEVILETFWALERKLTNDEQHAYNRILNCYSKIPPQIKLNMHFFTRNDNEKALQNMNSESGN